jgi:hypothetical protein
MASSEEQKLLIVKSKANYPLIIFAVAWLFAVVFNINRLYTNSIITLVLICGFTLYLIYQVIWIVWGKTIFKTDDNNLIVTTGFSIIKKTNRYNISQISAVRIKSVESSTYWGFTGFRFADDHTSVIRFDYNKIEIILGRNLAEFDYDKLKNWLS